jgi:hypothetical protein
VSDDKGYSDAEPRVQEYMEKYRRAVARVSAIYQGHEFGVVREALWRRLSWKG